MKTAEEIYGEMMATFTKKTGLEASGSGDLAVRLWAVAAEISALYLQSDWVARQCFPQTADGDQLDSHALTRGLERRAASGAVGSLRFSADSAPATDVAIPKGTVCMTAGLVRFETTAAGVLPAGGLTADVAARAVETGAVGNAGANTILTMAVPPVGISRCTNPAAFAGGVDGEEDGALRERILETFRRLPNGANAAFYEQGAMSFDRVAAAKAVSRPRGIGSVDVVVTTPEGLPDGALLQELTTYFSTRREIAVDVAVKAPAVTNVTLNVGVKPKAGYSFGAVSGAVDGALRGYFDGRLLGKSILKAKLGELIFAVAGVENYAITSPSGDVTVGAAVLPRLTGLTVTQLA